ncbi:MAG: hypothetical protein V4500_03155 [Pseudomonadota bacterium]
MPREWLVERIKDWLTDRETPPLPSGDFAENFASLQSSYRRLGRWMCFPQNFCCSPYRHAGIDEEIINQAERVGFASQLGMHHGALNQIWNGIPHMKKPLPFAQTFVHLQHRRWNESGCHRRPASWPNPILRASECLGVALSPRLLAMSLE